MSERVNIALPKGRIGDAAYSLFRAAGYGCPDMENGGRRLLFENSERTVCYFWVKPTDVPVYVERGAADIGVAGKDILLEYEPSVYELEDLGIGRCRMAVAGREDFEDTPGATLRVATKFPRIAGDYYAAKSRETEIIELHGSIELAPLLGLSDVIVDIVETGKTLAENHLKEFDKVADISARLIANKAAYKFRHSEIETIRERLAGRSGK